MNTEAHHIVVVTTIFLFLVVAALIPAHAETLQGFRAAMIRRGGGSDDTTAAAAINFTQAARDSRRRLTFLAARSSRTLSASKHWNNNETVPLRMDSSGAVYDMEFAIGTPPQKLTAIADTGSDLIWTKCSAAASSSSSSSRGTPSYNPSASSTFTKLPCSDRLCAALVSDSAARCAAAGGECDYTYSYGIGGDHPYTQGFLGSETFTLGGDAAPGVGFGCATSSEFEYGDGSGLVGLGRGPLSLVSQLDAGAFMYCLIRDASKASPLLFGSLAILAGGVQSTGLLNVATFYAVSLRGISIGSQTTAGVGASGGGVVFDSGTTLTYLAEPAYSDAKSAFLSQTAGLTRVFVDRDGFEACFEKPGRALPANAVPAMVLHFDGGADMALPVENYFVEVYEGVVCWVVQRSPSLSIIGNIMQTNYLVLHDVQRSVLSFQPANCESHQLNEATSSGSPRPLYQVFIAMLLLLLCFYIY